jgi:ribosomal protein L29
MSTQAQILANQANSQKSTGPSSNIGKETSSRNRIIHGLSDPENALFLLGFEDELEIRSSQRPHSPEEHQPQTETEHILVRRMWEAEWLRIRAIFFQTMCLDPETGFLREEKRFALFLRYQTTHERAFYKALNELQKLRNEKRNREIGFESQKRSAETHEIKKECHNLKKQEFELKKQRAAQPVQPKKGKKQLRPPLQAPKPTRGL